jgi:hypothetical protein
MAGYRGNPSGCSRALEWTPTGAFLRRKLESIRRFIRPDATMPARESAKADFVPWLPRLQSPARVAKSPASASPSPAPPSASSGEAE